MGRKKRVRFAALRSMGNVIDPRDCADGWFERTFGTERSVVLELGCGRGEYTLAVARRRPEVGVLGVDRNGSRLWKGATRALQEGLTNAVFLRAMVEYLEDHVPADRVSEIWLPFPDPLPKTRQARHRLVSSLFLERYRHILRAEGVVHLKTDDPELVVFAERELRLAGGRVVNGADAESDDEEAVRTTYEQRYRHEGRVIYTRAFCFD